jgi:glutaredoxin
MKLDAPESRAHGRLRDRFASAWRCATLLVLLLAPFFAAAEPPPAGHEAASSGTLQVFVRDGCPHCIAAEEFLAGLAERKPELRVLYRPVDRDESARDDLVERTRRAGLWPPGVPTFVLDDRVLVGFEDASRSGPALLAFLEEVAPPDAGVDLPWIGRVDAERLGLPLFTLAIGLLDGFNPCAVWVLLFLLSLLVRLKDRGRMALVAGTFVVVSGLVYYAFLAAWLNVFLAVGMSETVRFGLATLAIAIGAVNVKDFFAFKVGFSLSIPESAKPGLYARTRRVLRAEALPASLLAVAALAVVVNFVELLCTAGFPAMYTAVLAQHDLTPASHYAYLALYIVGYVADDTLMVATAVMALSSRKLSEAAGRWLKLLSGAVMLVLGVVMMLRPEWLV